MIFFPQSLHSTSVSGFIDKEWQYEAELEEIISEEGSDFIDKKWQ